jgi:hypothetical protein
MVVICEMTDKKSQQRRAKVDGAIRSVTDRSAAEENRALAPEIAETAPKWPPVD